MVLTSIIVLHVASGEVGDAMTRTLARALGQGLDAPGTVEVRPATGAPVRALLTATCREGGISASARVAWASPKYGHATVHVRRCATGDESNFDLSFAAADPPGERARAVGVVIASALHAASRSAAALPASPPVVEAPLPAASLPAAPLPAAPPAEVAPPEIAAPLTVAGDAPVAATTPVVPDVAGTAPIDASPVALGAPEPARRAAGSGRSLDAFALLGVPLGGVGGGVGGGLAGRRGWSNGWGLRAGLQARTGQIDAAQASLFEAGLTAGVTARLRPPSTGWAPGVGLRVDVACMYEAITHFSSDDPEPVRRQRFFPAAAGLLELTWPFGPLDFQLAAGMQATAVVADVVVRGGKVAEIPAWRATGEVGFRVGF